MKHTKNNNNHNHFIENITYRIGNTTLLGAKTFYMTNHNSVL